MPSTCSLPLVQTEANENDDANDEGGKYTSVGPSVQPPSKVETH